MDKFLFLHNFGTEGIFKLMDFHNMIGEKLYLSIVLIYIFLNVSEARAYFHVLNAICMSFPVAYFFFFMFFAY